METTSVSLLAALVGRIDRDELTDSLLATFRADIPGYSRLPDAVVRNQVRAVVRQNIDLCLDWVAGGGEPDTTRFEEFRESAQNRATEGMPLEDLLRAYRTGGTAAWRVIVAEATQEERDALPRAAEMIMDYLDMVSGIVAAAYLEERQHLVSEQERGMRALLDALVDGAELTPGHQETAAQLGLPVGGEFATFAAAIPGEGPTAHARAAADLRAAGALAVTEGDRIVGLAMPRQLFPGLVPPAAVVVREAPVARAELAASIADVRLGIELALRAGQTGVVDAHALTLDLLLAHSPRLATRLRDRVLGPLGLDAPAGRGDLLQTVSTYVGLERDRQATAQRLHIHPNTLDHRLRRARELTGLDLDNPEDLATMVLALREPR